MILYSQQTKNKKDLKAAIKAAEIIIKADLIKQSKEIFKHAPWSEELISNNQRSVIVSRNITPRDPSPLAELHQNYTDIFVVLEGEEEIFIGGELINKKNAATGEWRGKSLKHPRKYTIREGDVIIIPKNIAHLHGIGMIKMIVIKTA